MKTRRYLPKKMLLLLMAVAMLGGCTKEELGGGEPLPEGKYPLEFTSQMYGMEVTRATSGNTWDGGEEIALKVASDTRKYTVSDKSTGKITAAAGVTPFYWTSTTETKNVSAYYPFSLASASNITVKENQNVDADYQASDALYAAATSFNFKDATKSLTFKHLPAKVVANLKQGDGVTAAEVQGATVKFVSQSLTASFNNATGAVTAASVGSSSVVPNAISTPASGFQKSVQALLVPCQMKGSKFIEVAIGSDKFYYTPTSDTDGKLESGKVCTYEITVKRDGIEVVLTESGAWGNGGNEDVQSRSTKMEFTIDLASYSTDKTYILPFKTSVSTGSYTLTVDWGDGSGATTINPGTTLSSAASLLTHSYADAKEYTITISTTEEDFSKEQIPGFRPGNYNTTQNNAKKLKSLLSPLLNTGEVTFLQGFNNCTNLTSIPAGLFANNPQVTSFQTCFQSCKTLTSIPPGLFDNNPQVTNFSYCFSSCSGLTSIPPGLFDNNPQVTNFSNCFSGCSGLTSIPQELFDNNPQVTNFSNCFYNCGELTSIPVGLFDKNPQVTNFSNCFYRCSGLTSIPPRLFDKNQLVTNFLNCFYNCSGLTSIPPGLFDNNSKVTNFSYCFYNCSGLTSIPPGLFDNNPQVTNFSYCFSSCSGLTSIPPGLFDNNPLVKNFSYCFNNCSGLTGAIPQGLFDENPQVTNFSRCFNNCNNLTGSIPEKLFANNPLVTDFSYCFARCSKLTMNANIFCDEDTQKATRFKDKTVNFSFCFTYVGSDASVSAAAGAVPELWNYAGTFTSTKCFESIGTVTNASDISDAWKQ